MSNTLISAIALMVVVILILVAILLIVKTAITPKGTIKIDINGGKKTLDVTPGGNLMGTLANNQIFLPSAYRRKLCHPRWCVVYAAEGLCQCRRKRSLCTG